MKQLGDYGSYEEAAKDWQQTPQFAKLERAKRLRSLDILKDKWVVAHSAKAEQAGIDAQSPDFTAKASAVADKVLDYIKPPSIQGPPGSSQPPDIAGGINSAIKTALPRSNTQAAIDAALFAIGPEAAAGKAASNALYRMAARVAIPTVAGAVGGAVQGGSQGAMEGAAQGGAEGLGGEAVAGAIGLGKRTIGAADFSRLQSWLESRMGVKVPDVQTFRRLFRGGEIMPETEHQYNRVIKKVGSKYMVEVPVDPKTGTTLGGISPMLGNRMKMSLGEASQGLDDLEKFAWDKKGDLATGHQSRALMDTVHQVEGDIASQIDAQSVTNPNARKAAQAWYGAREQVRKGRVLKQMFSEPGVLEMAGKDPRTGEIIDNGKISFEKLQKLVSDAGPNGYKLDLQQAMGPGEQQSLSKVVHRGADEGAEDSPGRGLFASNIGTSSRGSFFGRLQAPWPARHVGDVPFDLGRGRALTGLITLGPYQLAHTVNEMTQMPPMEITKTPKEAANTPAPTVAPGTVEATH